jgi:hypothetical protein
MALVLPQCVRKSFDENKNCEEIAQNWRVGKKIITQHSNVESHELRASGRLITVAMNTKLRCEILLQLPSK